MLVVAGMLACFPSAARATVDLTGTYYVSLQAFETSPGYVGTFTFTQSGTDLTLTLDLSPASPQAFGPLSGTLTGGTVDPDAGTFEFPFPDTPNPFPPIYPTCAPNGIRGTATPDGEMIAGSWLEQSYNSNHTVCINPVGAFQGVRNPRCGDGIVTGTEQCDDGNTVDGDCCSATCQLEPSGSPCSDGDGCTAGDACNGAGVCQRGSYACAPCEACVAGTCTVTPEPACTATTGPAALTVDILHNKLAATAKTAFPPQPWYSPERAEHALCVFAFDGAAWAPLASAHVPALPMCAGESCWTVKKVRGTFRNPDGTPDGMQLLTLVKRFPASYKARAGTTALHLASSVPVGMQTVRVQLRSAAGAACLATDFTDLTSYSLSRLRLRR